MTNSQPEPDLVTLTHRATGQEITGERLNCPECGSCDWNVIIFNNLPSARVICFCADCNQQATIAETTIQ